MGDSEHSQHGGRSRAGGRRLQTIPRRTVGLGLLAAFLLGASGLLALRCGLLEAGVVVLLSLGASLAVAGIDRGRALRAAKTLFDASRDLILAVDSTGRIVDANSAALAVLARHRDDLVGHHVSELITQADAVAALDDSLCQQPREFIGADGRLRWLELSVWREAPGRCAWLVARDVTEQVQALARLRESEQRYKSLFEQHPDAVYSIDLQGRYTSHNDATVVMGGFSFPNLVGRHASDPIHPDDLPLVTEHFLAAIAGEAQVYECRLRGDDGRVLHAHVTNLPIVVDGKVTGVYGITRDVTDRVRADRKLEISRQRYKALYDRNPDAVFSLDIDGRFRRGNLGCVELSGYPGGELYGVHHLQLIAPDDRAAVGAHIARAFDGEAVDYECRLVRKDGSLVDCRVTAMPIVVDGEVTGVYGVAKDMTAQRELERELRRRARSDALTGLPNREELFEQLSSALHASAPVRLLFLDLDRFKAVNDELGHAVGDGLLRSVVARIAGAVRGEDLVTRFAGDEFVVLLAPGTSEEAADAIAARVLDAVRAPYRIDGHDLSVTASLGLAVSDPGDGPVDLLRRADTAMYDAKATGRDRLVQAGSRS